MNRKLAGMIVMAMILIVFLWFENNWIVISRYGVGSPKLPGGFDGFKILQISDLHNKSFGKKNNVLIRKIKEQGADIIVITGDLLDSIDYNEAVCKQFIADIVEIAPVYFVTGNHECGTKAYGNLEIFMKEKGVHVLRNRRVEIKKGDAALEIAGIDDLNYFTYDYKGNYSFGEILKKLNLAENEESDLFKEQGDELFNPIGRYSILLSHRPEYIELYSEIGYDLVFSGHAHGGQVRIPFLGGLVAPNQGFFPTYTQGIYEIAETKLVVSRGLGNSRIKQRLFNKPEIVVVTLSHQE